MRGRRGIEVTVVGTTTWGTTLAWLVASKGIRTWLLARTRDEADVINQTRVNRRFLPDLALPEALTATSDLEAALAQVGLVVLAVPSHTLRDNLAGMAESIPAGAVIVSAAKGIEPGTGLRMTQVVESLCPRREASVCALSGPNLAREIAKGLPAATVVASRNRDAAAFAQQMLITPAFRVYTNDDVVGVELGGALKNVIALAAGICDGMGYGDNSKAGLITRGLAEITRLAEAAGGSPRTLSGLAGLGDLIATCSSRLSRNHFVGEQLGKGRKLDEILANLDEVAEGVNTTRAALQIARRYGVELPIAEQMHRVLFEGCEPRLAVQDLLSRVAKSEFVAAG